MKFVLGSLWDHLFDGFRDGCLLAIIDGVAVCSIDGLLRIFWMAQVLVHLTGSGKGAELGYWM
eukprot:scaffold364703_cov28-Attheya_sp.AAC.1